MILGEHPLCGTARLSRGGLLLRELWLRGAAQLGYLVREEAAYSLGAPAARGWSIADQWRSRQILLGDELLLREAVERSTIDMR